MQTIFEGEDRFYLGARATILDDSREVASEWAVRHIHPNPAYAFILGRYVEADNANQNKQFFPLSQLQAAQSSITHAPMNINHNSRNVVGAFTATEMIYPTTESASDDGSNPYIESLAVFWKFYFPDEYRAVQMANSQSGLHYSMEAIPESLSTIGGSDDAATYPYEGRTSPNYPEEINSRSVDAIVLNKPHFVAGALIIPPEKPGWKGADARQVANLMRSHQEEAEAAYEAMRTGAPEGDPASWEAMMQSLLLKAYEREEGRQFTPAARKKAAGSGAAMKDGSYPIVNVSDLKNAIQAIGRAKNPAAAKAHIRSRAKALGKTDLIPDTW